MEWLERLGFGELNRGKGGPMGPAAVAAQKRLRAKQSLSGDEKRALAVFTATFSMLAKLAHADGVVCLDEIEAVDQVVKDEFELDHDARHLAIQIFTAAKSSPHGLKYFAAQFRRGFKHEEVVRIVMYELLVRIVSADGVIAVDEEKDLRAAQSGLKIPDRVAAFVRRAGAHDGEQAWAILHCPPGTSLDDVERRYHQLREQWSPEALRDRGVPTEFANLANKQLALIEAAFTDLVTRLGR